MYSVESDRSKRLLVISATGKVTKKEVEIAALQVREMMKEITPGFRVLTDFRWLDRMEPAATAHLAEIMDALAEKEVAAVVRSSRSTQRHWLKYSFAISLRPANQARYLRVVSGSIVSVDGRIGVRRLRRASPYQSWSRVQRW
jgi:hypothetical protein